MQLDDKRAKLLAAVTRRRCEIRNAILVRVQTIGPEGGTFDVEYLDGIRSAIETAIDHTIRESIAIDEGTVRAPNEVFAQTRLAARRRVPLEVVLRRYHAGHSILGDFVAEEAERLGIPPALLRVVLRSLAVVTEEVSAQIGGAYRDELQSTRPITGERRRAERVRRLLGGELVDSSGLEYDLNRWHVGVAARGLGSPQHLLRVARDLNSSRLAIADDGLDSLWFGWAERPDLDRFTAALSSRNSEGATLGIGEPATGLAGWRLTHEQARAALGVAMRAGETTCRYINVPLVASALQDELLSTSLLHLYVDPLNADRNGGAVLRETLRVFLDADHNVTSTAAILGVSRNTVTNRLRAAESRIGHLKPSRAGDLALALRLHELMTPNYQTGSTACA